MLLGIYGFFSTVGFEIIVHEGSTGTYFEYPY